jgi:DnaK suppressor protein
VSDWRPLEDLSESDAPRAIDEKSAGFRAGVPDIQPALGSPVFASRTRPATALPRSEPPPEITQEDLSYFEMALLAERQALLEKARRSWIEDREFDRNELSDEIDQASAEYVQTMVLRLRDREAYYLRKIEAALERIRDGTFGICAECEQPIPGARLKARPVALLCAACKEEHEMIERDYTS